MGTTSTWKGWRVHEKKEWEASLESVIMELVQVSEQGTDIIVTVLQENETLKRDLRQVPIKAKAKLMK